MGCVMSRYLPNNFIGYSFVMSNIHLIIWFIFILCPSPLYFILLPVTKCIVRLVLSKNKMEGSYRMMTSLLAPKSTRQFPQRQNRCEIGGAGGQLGMEMQK